MNWLKNKLKWAIAGKELNQLQRLKTDLQTYRQWLAEFPELAFALDHLAKMNSISTITFDDVDGMDISKLREHLRKLRLSNLERKALSDVAEERRRQVEVEGFTHENDDKYDCCELSLAAGCYAMFTSAYPEGDPCEYWIWDKKWWKPSEDRRKNCIKAAALLIAEIERIDRTITKKGRTA
ncbi:hypothetical protein [Undibacterium curvum]|uniref:hypothetical protein n=1 Tax=Undibacterium curvum TaxID=2762294 RepID=UPI003D0C3DF5